MEINKLREYGFPLVIENENGHRGTLVDYLELPEEYFGIYQYETYFEDKFLRKSDLTRAYDLYEIKRFKVIER